MRPCLDTPEQRRDFQRWQTLRNLAFTDPAAAQAQLAAWGNDVKIPIYIQGAIHGNEYEGADAAMQLVEKLATTPYGEDAALDAVLDHLIVLVNVDQNPDGRVAGTRANANGFDLNRDFFTQSQSETKAAIRVIHDWLPTEILDLHGYNTPTLTEPGTKPHNPSIDYDLFIKWGDRRADANEAALNAVGLALTRPLHDWCANGGPPGASGLCAGGVPPGPAVAEGWDDWGPFYTPTMYIGLDGTTVEMCNSTGTTCGVPGSTTHTRGRLGSLEAQDIVNWSTMNFMNANRGAMLHDQLERYRRNVTDAPRPACCAAPFDVGHNWMVDYPKAYVIPVGAGQRSDPEANRLVEWLLANSVEINALTQDTRFGDQTFQRGSYIVWMTQGLRGFADTALSAGTDISAQIGQLYASPASWSHGSLWGADVVTIPDGADFGPATNRILKPNTLTGGVEPGPTTNTRYALELDSPTAVRAVNALLSDGMAAWTMTQALTVGGRTLPAGSIVFAGGGPNTAALDAAGREHGLNFVRVPPQGIAGLERVERAPKIAVLVAAIDQQTWVLKNLGFPVDPISIATLNAGASDPLADYDVIFNTGNWPTAAQTTARARLTAFFARGGGYIGAGAAGGTFLQTGGQVSGVAAATRSGNGRSGIVNWLNDGSASSPIVGSYPARDTTIMDPPTWFTSVPPTLTVDARLPTNAILASGLWLTSDAQSATAAGAAVIAHGQNIAGTARIALFAMNPLYRADPERMWPAIGSAAYWALAMTDKPSVPAQGEVGAQVPATLSLTLGAPAAFGAFAPGVDRTYTATTTATVVSTAGSAGLTVTDPSAAAPGRLVNGALALPSPLRISGSTLPATVKTYADPTSNDIVPIEFSQQIGASGALRTGAYAKTLTFTLSTDEP